MNAETRSAEARFDARAIRFRLDGVDDQLLNVVLERWPDAICVNGKPANMCLALCFEFKDGSGGYVITPSNNPRMQLRQAHTHLRGKRNGNHHA